MPIGDLKQKASLLLVVFVFACIFIIITLLYITQKTEAIAQNLSSVSDMYNLDY